MEIAAALAGLREIKARILNTAQLSPDYGMHEMWTSRLMGLAIGAVGAALLVFVFYQTSDHAVDAIYIYKIGLPGLLLLGMVGLIAFAFGSHLLVAPKSARAVRDKLFQRRRPAP
ncbi:MAG: hypothetical protein ACHP7N_15995 [Caulobacterales bacterium]